MKEQVVLPPKEAPTNGDLKAPFERRDRWGEFGMAPQPLYVKIVLGLEAILFLPLRALGAFLILILYWLICKASAALPPAQRAALTVTTGKFASRSVLFCLGFIRIKWVTLPGGDTGPRPGGIVSNHCSYTDILLHMADSFPAFVARKSTANLPFVGIISQMMSCLYVDRDRSGPNHIGVSELVKQRMEAEAAGLTGVASRPLLLFPEGTTSNGDYMLPFKTGAFLAGVPVQPVVIKYHRASLWPTWETIPASWHMFLMMCHPRHMVTFTKLPVYVPNEEEKADPKLYAQNVRKKMMEVAGTKDTVAVFEDKMRYLISLKKKYGKRVPKKVE